MALTRRLFEFDPSIIAELRDALGWQAEEGDRLAGSLLDLDFETGPFAASVPEDADMEGLLMPGRDIYGCSYLHKSLAEMRDVSAAFIAEYLNGAPERLAVFLESMRKTTDDRFKSDPPEVPYITNDRKMFYFVSARDERRMMPIRACFRAASSMYPTMISVMTSFAGELESGQAVESSVLEALGRNAEYVMFALFQGDMQFFWSRGGLDGFAGWNLELDH